MGFGKTPIREVELDLDSRHELVAVLAGLQHVYGKREAREEILELIKGDVLGERREDWGAEGMDYWEVFVLASVRQGCNLDYDALEDLANNHRALRELLGVDEWEGGRFDRSTIHGNVSQVKKETLKSISELTVDLGHKLAPDAGAQVRGDMFVPEANIHYPTDASLVVDGLRVTLRVGSRLSEMIGSHGWRQYAHNLKKGQKLHRKIQAASKRGENGKEARRELCKELIDHVRGIADRALDTIAEARVRGEGGDAVTSLSVEFMVERLLDIVAKTQYVCDLAERRMVKDETIPNADKVFSVFEWHTELINRGKSPNPIEFGRRLVVVEDREGFIVEYRVVPRGELEQDILIPLMKDLQHRLDHKIREASFDRGFYTPKNLDDLKEIVSLACLPRKGRPRGKALEEESRVNFRRARRRHSGIESAIHGLVAGCGLDRCRDRGEEGYEHYVALAVSGRNLHMLGRLVLERKRRRRKPA